VISVHSLEISVSGEKGAGRGGVAMTNPAEELQAFPSSVTRALVVNFRWAEGVAERRIFRRGCSRAEIISEDQRTARFIISDHVEITATHRAKRLPRTSRALATEEIGSADSFRRVRFA
jgi:hypothetical protein